MGIFRIFLSSHDNTVSKFIELHLVTIFFAINTVKLHVEEFNESM